MTHTEIQQTINKVHGKNQNWEIKGNAYEYAYQLWIAAHECIEDTENKDQETLAKQTHDILHQTGSLAKCLTDKFRRLVISHHARGLTTSQTIDWILPDEMLKDVTPFHLFKYANVCGYKNVKNFLLMRISYLKPTDPRWPQKKYGEHWKKERQHYKEALNDMPFTDIREQIATLSEHYANLNTYTDTYIETRDIERLHRCKLQTIAAINLLTRTPHTDFHQQAILQQNMTQALFNAISKPTPDNQLQTQPQKQLTGTNIPHCSAGSPCPASSINGSKKKQ